MKQLDIGMPELIDPATLVEGVEITPDGGEIRVYAVRESIVLVHAAYVVIVCTDCGHIKSGTVCSGKSLSETEARFLMARIDELARCTCMSHRTLTREEIVRDIVPVVEQELARKMRFSGGGR